MRVLRIINLLAALMFGGVLWLFTLASSGGGGPFPSARSSDIQLFFIPIIAFAVPLAALAFLRGYVGTGAWLLAGAPVLGALNFVLAVLFRDLWPGAWNTTPTSLTLRGSVAMTAAWLLLLGLVVGSIKLGEMADRADRGRNV